MSNFRLYQGGEETIGSQEAATSRSKISVLMSVYEREDVSFFELSLRSLLDQYCPADELVLVEDGPIGADLAALIESFRSQLHIRSVRLPKNVGLGQALSAGLEVCKYELVARMDTDDVALPHRFSRQEAQFRADPALSILGGWAVEMDNAGSLGRLRRVPNSDQAIKATLWANPILHPTVMFRKQEVLRVGGYSAGAIRCEDYELWFRCAQAGLKFGNLPEPLIHYRFSASTHRKQSKLGLFRQGLIGFRGSRSNGLSLWKQFGCFVPFARSLLPRTLQHSAYKAMRKFDPRN